MYRNKNKKNKFENDSRTLIATKQKSFLNIILEVN